MSLAATLQSEDLRTAQRFLRLVEDARDGDYTEPMRIGPRISFIARIAPVQKFGTGTTAFLWASRERGVHF